MNRTRSHPRLLQALLALLFLAWLPATGMAIPQDEFAVQFAGTASFEDGSEGGEVWPDGGPDDDPLDARCAAAPLRRGPCRGPRREAERRAIWLDAAHPATGPPAV